MTDKGFYITTPIYYVNDVPHIGHAYTTVAADVLSRHHRLRGRDTYFLTGTDEHGQKIQRAAMERGLTAQELADRTVVNFQDLWKVLGIEYDDFIRTTEERHERVVQHIFSKLLAQGDIYKGSYEGWYCVPCETYVPESQMGEGRTCPDCKRKLEKMTEESYFFRLSKYAAPLLAFYEAHPEAVQPRGRYNEIVSFIRGGLMDQSISRTTISWGVPVPENPRHVVYVWFDALINYLSALGYPDEGGLWERYWPAVHHLVGKDIIRFHSVIWPAMVMALGLNPPVMVFAHGWWTVEGEKMSKSKGNVVDPFDMARRYGADAFRYFLLREVPFGLDGDFSEQALVQRINSDLANDLGNLLHRTLQMVNQFCDGEVPASKALHPEDEALCREAEEAVEAVDRALESFAFDEALKVLWGLVARGNKYIDETMPWRLGKEGDRDRLGTVLGTLAQTLRIVALLVTPFMPSTGQRMWQQLGLRGAPDKITSPAWGGYPAGTLVHKGEVLFPRIDLDLWQKERQARSEEDKSPKDPGDHEAEVSIDDFRKLELRVALVTAVEPVPKADKLYKMSLDLGYEKREIVSGIREFYPPEDLVGKRIVVICNLKPAKLRGVMSCGMLLAAERFDGKNLALLTVDRDMELGARIH